MSSRCSCNPAGLTSLRAWLSVLEVLHPEVVRGTLAIGCHGACRVAALLTLSGTSRWLLRPSPPLPTAERIEKVPSSIIDPVLRDAATVRFLSPRVLSVGALFFPPFVCFEQFSVATGQHDLVAACDVFGVLVRDGMPVREALHSAPELA